MIKDISWRYQKKFICLLEMHVGRARAGRIIKKFGLTDWFFEGGVGFSGGVWCMWRKDHWKVKDERNHRQFVHLEVAFENEPPWFLTVVYGCPQVANQGYLWDGLKDISNQIQGAWCVRGDFNSMLTLNDTRGTNNLSRDFQRFADCLLDCGIHDIGFQGQTFTWQRNGIH